MSLLSGLFGGTTTQEKSKFPTEFHRLAEEFPAEAADFAEEYPLVAVVTLVAGSFFGFFNLLHFTISSTISSLILLPLVYGLWKGINGTEAGFMGKFWQSLIQVKNFAFLEEVEKVKSK